MPGADHLADPLEEFLADQDPAARSVVIALDRAVRSATEGFDVAIKYHMLMYTFNVDWRTWVCAIGTSKSSVALRFLYGVMLDDPKKVLRAGTSVLMTWDFAFGDEVDERGVRTYVREAVARYDEYRADADEILSRHRKSARTGGSPPER
jgi:hypothetical protein